MLNSENKYSPIIILGMHHSGTSLLTRILSNAGIFIVQDIKHNETSIITDFLNDQLIMNMQWAKNPVLSLKEVLTYEKVFKLAVENHLWQFYSKYVSVMPKLWGFKDPRICILLPLYIKTFYNAKFIHIYRDAEKVALSLANTSKRGVGKIEDLGFWKLLHQQHVNRVRYLSPKLKKENIYFELSYEYLCKRPEEIVSQLLSFLSIPFTESLKDFLRKEVRLI